MSSNEALEQSWKNSCRKYDFIGKKKEERSVASRRDVLYPLSSGLYAREFRFVTHVNVMFVLL